MNNISNINAAVKNPMPVYANDIAPPQSAVNILNLSRPMEISYGDRFGKKVVFTFDDGPNPAYTPKLLDLLKKYNIKATFFVLGQNVKRYPDIIRRIVNEGHTLGNHSYDHPAMTTLSNEEIKKQLALTQNAVNNALGYNYPLRQFRPPYGDVNERVIRAASEAGATQMILWNADSEDWKHNGGNTVIEKVTREIGSDGGVILFHDIHPEALETVPVIFQKLKNNLYNFPTIADLLKHKYNLA